MLNKRVTFIEAVIDMIGTMHFTDETRQAITEVFVASHNFTKAVMSDISNSYGEIVKFPHVMSAINELLKYSIDTPSGWRITTVTSVKNTLGLYLGPDGEYVEYINELEELRSRVPVGTSIILKKWIAT